MREHRVRIAAPLLVGRVRLAEAAAHHLLRVLRLRVGAPVVAFDGEGREAHATLVASDELGTYLELTALREAGREPRRQLTIAPALLKGDKLSEVVRMATELGAVHFSPVVSARCVVTTLSPAKHGRLQRVAEEASRQSLRTWVPPVDESVPLASLRWSGVALVADPRAAFQWHEIRERHAPALTLISGPEGGFRDDEIEQLLARGAHSVRLVASVLRAETAPVAMAAAYLLAGGDG